MKQRHRITYLLSICLAALPGAPARGQACIESCCRSTGTPCAATCGADAERIEVDPAINRREPVAGPGDGIRDLHDSLERIRARYRVPGLVAAVWQDAGIVAAGAAGVRAAGAPEPVRVTDRLHLGSCGKAMTATLAAVLVQDGFISWTTTVADALPDLAPGLRAEYRSATLRQLLTHRGGFPGGRPAALGDLQGPLPRQREALVKIAGRLEPAGRAGEGFTYSDLGYAVAGAMLERATGRSWETLIIEKLARPLGMTSVGFGAPGVAGSPDEPRGHRRVGAMLEPIAPGPGADGAAPVVGPAGTIHASILDWARFAGLHAAGVTSPRLLDADAIATLHADPYEQGYASGWGLTEAGDLVHTGSCGAWAALIRVMPDRGAAVVIASNFGGPSAFQANGDAMTAVLVEMDLVRDE